MTKETQQDYDWLPALIKLEDYKGDWNAYIDAVYDAFATDFVDTPPSSVLGKRFSLRGNPRFQNREYTFWHMTSEGKVEEQRTPDLRRCETIRWARAVLDVLDSKKLPTWRQERSGSENIIIALPDFSYLMVLADRGNYILLITAYPIEYQYKRNKYRKEYEKYQSQMAETAPEGTVS